MAKANTTKNPTQISFNDAGQMVEQRKAEWMEEHGIKPRLTLEKGTNVVLIDTTATIEIVETDFGTKYDVPLSGDNEGKVLRCTPFLLEKVLDAVKLGNKLDIYVIQRKDKREYEITCLNPDEEETIDEE